MDKKQLDARIVTFTELINRGVEAWIQAGQILCELIQEDPLAREKIMLRCPWMTDEVLTGFERIGRKEVYPYLLLDHSVGSQKLIQFDYEQQKALYAQKISVATKVNGEIVVKSKRLQEMSRREVETAFSEVGLRPVGEQRKLLRPKQHIRDTHHAHVEDEERHGPAPPEEEAVVVMEKETPVKCLGNAQASILRARELITEEKSLSRAIDRLFTEALNTIGNLRFELKEPE